MKPHHLLIVDDEPALLELMRRFLERRGFQVDLASNPEQALALFRAAPDQYSMVVTDLVLGEMSGEDLIDAMRQIRPDLPALIASGYPHTPRLAGVGFLQKPVLPQVLADAIEKALSSESR